VLLADYWIGLKTNQKLNELVSCVKKKANTQ